MQIILLISLSDFCGSLAFSCGYVTSPVGCAWQGGLVTFFFRASWAWTLALSHQLYCLVKEPNNPPPVTFRTLNAIIWGCNVVAACLPLLVPHGFTDERENVQYGTDDLRYGEIVCTLKSTPSLKTANDVMLAVLFVPLLLALCGMFYYFVRVLLHFRAKKRDLRSLQTPLLGANAGREAGLLAHDLEDSAADAHALSVESSGISEVGWSDQVLLDKLSSLAFVLSLYPAALFVCWFPLFVSFMVANGFSHEDAAVTSFKQDPARYFEVTSISVASLHGLLLACIFFTHSPRARRLWAHWFQSNFFGVYTSSCAQCVSCCNIAACKARGEEKVTSPSQGGRIENRTRQVILLS